MEELRLLKLNIINWYEFKAKDSILCYGKFDKIIIDYLSQIFNKVIFVENNLEKLTNIKDKFDYIFLFDVLDQKSSDEQLTKEINLIEKLLNDNGSLLLITRNNMGVKNIINRESNGFSKERMSSIINNSNIKNSKFYYGFPDINDLNLIITDNYVTSLDDIRRNINFSDELSDKGIKEDSFLYDILKNDIKNFKNFSNVFFIEINANNNFSDINAVYYNNIRKEEHRLITKVYNDYAIKSIWSLDSVNHINQIKNNIEILKQSGINSLDTYQDGYIKSTILKDAIKLDDSIGYYIKNNDEKYLDIINSFKNRVLLKLQYGDRQNNIFKKYNIEIDEDICNKLNFVKYGLWDLTFQNVFIKESEFWVYDQEWFEENIPIEFILFRSINLLDSFSESEKKCIFEKIGIIDYIDLFKKLESELQKKLTNYSIINLYFNTLYVKPDTKNDDFKYIKEIFEKKYNNLFKEYEFQAKLVKSKELLYDQNKQMYKNYDDIKQKLEEEVRKNSELEKIIGQPCVQKALKIQNNSKIILPAYRIGKKGLRSIKKVGSKIIRIPAKFIYNLISKSIRRKIKYKIQFSRRLSKIVGIPMFEEYNHNLMLMSPEDYSIRPVYSQISFNKTIGIHLHLYYDDLAQEFYNYLSNIPYSFDLYISVRKEAKTNKIKKLFSKILNLNNLEILNSENCGRDFGPMFVLFADKLKKYDYIMHIHSKKSLRMGSEQSDWRNYLLKNLLGSPERVMKCFYLMENYNIGLVYPDTHSSAPYWGHFWLNEAGHARSICERINMPFNDDFLEFSAGSMFWAKKDAIEPLLNLNLTWEDFGKEQKQTGGTLEYVFEKIPGLVTKNRGYDIAIYNEEKNVFLLNKGEKQLSLYYLKNKENVLKDLENYDIITFDIFDTLITRKIYNPDDLFLIMEKRIRKSGINIENFKKLRKDAELNVRVKKNFENDCSIDEIYNEFINLTGISKEQTDLVKNIEFNTELEFCIPRREVLDLYNSLLKKSKKIVLISDMYLTKDMLNSILNNCGYYNYFELLVSSEVGYRKDNGTMWKYFKDKYGVCNTIHVGDNEESDIHKPLELGQNVYHLMQGKKMYYASNYYLNKELNLNESVIMGSVINKGLFNSPFAMYKNSKNSIVKDEFTYGYSILGPIIFEYLRWIINSVKNKPNEVLLFASREGWYLRRIYEHIISKLEDENLANIENHYFYISRRAISVAQIEKIEDIFEIMKKSFKGTLREVMYYRLGFKIDDLEDKIIELPRDYELVKNVIIQNYPKIMEQVKYEKENYLLYIKNTLGDYKDKNINFLDLGYSGTAQYYLSLLMNKKIKGKYFVISENIKPLGIGCEVESCYNENIYDISEIISNPIYSESILIEAFLTAPQGQLQYFKNEDNKIEPVFNFDNNLDKAELSDLIYNAIIEYVDDMFKAFGKEDILNICVDKKIFLNLYKCFGVDSRNINEHMKKLFNIDDYYCSNGVINGLDLKNNT